MECIVTRASAKY